MTVELELITAKAAVLILMLAPFVGAWRPGWFGLLGTLEGRLLSAMAALFSVCALGFALVLLTLGVKFLIS